MTSKIIASAVALAASLLPVAFAQEGYLGEIRQFGMNFCPRGWAPTNGQLLSISQNTALFSLLGTTYGGDGRTTFALPNLAPLSNTSTSSMPASPVGGEARVYEHCDFEGWSLPLGLGDYRASDLRAPYTNNNVSAVRASPGWQVTLFDGDNLDGQSVTITGQDSCLVARNFNDRTSSIRVTRSTPTPAPATGKPAGVSCIATVGIYPSRQ
ncbi:MAG: tail fiber protein [Hyphomonadaceae bacterium]